MWGMKDRYFGLRGGWLTFWVTVACGTDMTLFGYDQGEWEDDCKFIQTSPIELTGGNSPGVFGGVVVTDDFLVWSSLHTQASRKSKEKKAWLTRYRGFG